MNNRTPDAADIKRFATRKSIRSQGIWYIHADDWMRGARKRTSLLISAQALPEPLGRISGEVFVLRLQDLPLPTKGAQGASLVNDSEPEEEVLSISAANTFELVSRHAVYSCPVNRKYKQSLYMTFRSVGSFMDRLFLVENTYDQVCSIDAVKNDPKIPESHKERILAYLKDPKAAEVLVELNPTNKDFGRIVRFYVLDRVRVIWLPREAKPENPCEGHVYYTLKELLNPVGSMAARPARKETD